MKYCVNCQHYYLQPEAGSKYELGRCLTTSVTSPVSGLPTPPDQLEWCSVMRLASNKVCGISALLFKEKESNHV